MIAILGSGFGLYGYLPALVGGCGQRIALPEEYRVRFGERPELARFAGSVQWTADRAAALECAEGVVLALRPIDQMAWLPQCLQRDNIGSLLLEKPLAVSPQAATTLLGELGRSRKVARLGYTFRYTAWGRQLLDTLSKTGESGSLSIRWHFLAHHFRFSLHNWKRSTAAGGGTIRFYGIQLIALLAEIGYRDVRFSRSFGPSADEIERWTASFAGPSLPGCDLEVDSKAAVDMFRVELLGHKRSLLPVVIANQIDPFDLPPSEGLDRRVPILTALCRTLWEPNRSEPTWYGKTIELWQAVEEKTQFELSESRSDEAHHLET